VPTFDRLCGPHIRFCVRDDTGRWHHGRSVSPRLSRETQNRGATDRKAQTGSWPCKTDDRGGFTTGRPEIVTTRPCPPGRCESPTGDRPPATAKRGGWTGSRPDTTGGWSGTTGSWSGRPDRRGGHRYNRGGTQPSCPGATGNRSGFLCRCPVTYPTRPDRRRSDPRHLLPEALSLGVRQQPPAPSPSPGRSGSPASRSARTGGTARTPGGDRARPAARGPAPPPSGSPRSARCTRSSGTSRPWR